MYKILRFGPAICLMAILALGILLISSSSSPAPTAAGRVLMPQVTNTLKYPLTGVDGGSFMMGGTAEQGEDTYDDEFPVHRVTVRDFFIGTYPVTQGLWREVMGSLPSKITGNMRNDNFPMIYVSWKNCQEFISKLNRRRSEMDLAEFSSWRFRLPTEAEWEYAARGGNKSRGYKYAGSNDIEKVAWYYDGETSYEQVAQVGMLEPNELGIYDMNGNVFEWCSDWYDKDYYKNSPTSDPRGPASGSNRVVRGGCYRNLPWHCRVSARDGMSPDAADNCFGFRLVLAP